MLDTHKIDIILNRFLEQFELTAFAGTDFNYYPASNRIEYAFVVSERMDRLFMNFAKSIGLKAKVDIFLLSLFHEIGHHETIDELDDFEYNFCQDVKNALTDSDEDCQVYFRLPDELAATKWAVDYINKNPEEINYLWYELGREIRKFYETNGII